MKFAELNGKILRVVSAAPWEILLEEDNQGMPGGQKFMVRPGDAPDDFQDGNLDLIFLKEEKVK